MSGLGDDLWAKLSGDPPTGSDLTARRAVPDKTNRLLAAIDVDGRRHLLVELQDKDPDFRDTQSRGLWATTNSLSVSGLTPARYIDVVCNDQAGFEAFDIIGGELAIRLATAKEVPGKSVAQVLAKWRRFWGQTQKGVLSKEAQLGLFAEVWFLYNWLIPKAGTSKALESWRGPFGSRHDFESLGHSIEAKATTSTRGIVHRIHGIEQLVPPDDGHLFLFSIRVREEGGGTTSLPAIIADCRSQLEVDDEAIMRFETALVQSGYSPVHDEEYARVRLRVVAEELYQVKDDFPRLTPAELRDGLPAGIQYVEYEINLSGFDHLLVAKEPGSMPAHVS